MDVPVEGFEQQIQLNYIGTVKTIKAVLPGMLTRRSGHIVIVSSMLGVIGRCMVEGGDWDGDSAWTSRGSAGVAGCQDW
jgi:NAD(P)-dependent dehydrogenase (short-subunit alcohol dehydrogenase family)